MYMSCSQPQNMHVILHTLLQNKRVKERGGRKGRDEVLGGSELGEKGKEGT